MDDKEQEERVKNFLLYKVPISDNESVSIPNWAVGLIIAVFVAVAVLVVVGVMR